MKTALKLIIASWFVIFGEALLMMVGDRIEQVTVTQRVAAGVFLFAVVALFTYELGWGGGKKTEASHITLIDPPGS